MTEPTKPMTWGEAWEVEAKNLTGWDYAPSENDRSRFREGFQSRDAEVEQLKKERDSWRGDCVRMIARMGNLGMLEDEKTIEALKADLRTALEHWRYGTELPHPMIADIRERWGL